MSLRTKPKGPWVHRFSIHLLTVLLAILVFWVLGFFDTDIRSIKGPQYDQIKEKYVNQQLLVEQQKLTSEIGKVERDIGNTTEEMRIVSDSTQNLQKTIRQLIELQKLTIQKLASIPETGQPNLSRSLARFLENQKRYQAYHERLSELSDQKRTLEAERLKIGQQIEQQRQPAELEYKRLSERHRIRIACLQLLVLVPLFAIGAFLVIKKRDSIYLPLFLGYGVATLLKMVLVIHEYFPSRYFKYVIAAALLIVVVKLLVHVIRVVAFPKARWLTKQYREAYERFLCPVCEYPIRTGSRKFLFWTRRTVNNVVLPTRQSSEECSDERYACPACGTSLFEECPECHKVRHSLLPYCQHCNAEKEMKGYSKDVSTVLGEES